LRVVSVSDAGVLAAFLRCVTAMRNLATSCAGRSRHALRPVSLAF
jgi:hypothetical protein